MAITLTKLQTALTATKTRLSEVQVIQQNRYDNWLLASMEVDRLLHRITRIEQMIDLWNDEELNA